MKAARRPTSALSRRGLLGLRTEAPAEARAAVVARVDANCVSTLGTACRICAEHCEPGAIRFRLALGGRSTPLVGEECDGCGACEPVCPVSAIALVPKPELAPCV